MSDPHPALVERQGFRFIPGPFQFSGGVAAAPGYAIERVCLSRPVPLLDGFARVERLLAAEGVPLTALCACELRSPAPFTDAGFVAFNREYVGTLQRWGVMQGDTNPVARSNVCPELDKPHSPSLYAFSFVRPEADAPPSFLLAGSGEARDGVGPYRERCVRFQDTSTDAIGEKQRFVRDIMERNMAQFGFGWPDVTGVQVYTVFDIHPHLANDLVARGVAGHGVTWHYCRPPIQDLEYEMDCRAVFRERVLPA